LNQFVIGNLILNSCSSILTKLYSCTSRSF